MIFAMTFKHILKILTKISMRKNLESGIKFKLDISVILQILRDLPKKYNG